MFKPSLPTPPRAIPQAHAGEDPLADIAVGEAMGAFNGYLRRTKSSAAGVMVQVFGENGPDSDTITAFHLSRFLDLMVKVTVWMIKDKDGQLMRKNGQDLKLVEFIAQIKRPTPSNHGQTAQFMAANGVNADEANTLNLTKYLDALVHVEIHRADAGMTVSDIVTETPTDELLEAAQRKTPSEMKGLKEQQRKAKEAQRQLGNVGFFLNEAVWMAVGDDFAFQTWVTQQPCCHPGEVPCDRDPVMAFPVPGMAGRYQFVPLCREHAAEWTAGKVDLKGTDPMNFLRTKREQMVTRWAKDGLRQALNIPAQYDPTPRAISEWAYRHHLSRFLPPGFNVLTQD